MLQKQDLTGISVSLEINQQQRLFISLTEDGSIKRMGSGQPDDGELDLYIGQTSEPFFNQLVEAMPDDFLENTGSYTIPDSQGIPLKLNILMKGSGSETTGLEFIFGTQSTGIPSQVMDFVREARSLTEDWFQEQQQATRED